jgi:hypothetical protein
MRFYLFYFLLGYSALQAQTIPPPSQTDEIIIDAGTAGKADPNDRIRYKVTIQNTGGSGAQGTQLNIVPDPRTTFVAGTFRSSPLALPDSYACTGNVGITIPAASGLKANDFDDNIPGLTVTAGTFATTQGGSIMINADGSFIYTPPAGFTGSDTYTYTLNDANGVGGGVPTTDVGLVTITVSNLIWFIDNTGGGSGGNGTLATPFKTLGDFNTSSTAAGDVIYIEETGTNYSGGIALQNNERLFGEGHTGAANLSGVLPFTMAPNSNTLPNINGLRPVILNPAGDGIQLASGNSVRGLNLGNCSDFAIDDNGTVGTLTISEVNINTTGGGFRADNGGALTVTLGPLTATGGTNGIHLASTSGAFSAGAVSITNPSSTGIIMQSASNTLTLGATTVSKTGAGTGVSLASSSGNVSFTSLAITTSNGSALIGTEHTGSIAVTNNTGSLSATAGAAIDLTRTTGNTSIDLKFNAVTTVNTPAFGIRLDNVGGTGLTVSGATNLGMAVGSTNGILMENVSAGTYNISTAGVVNITNRQSNGIVMSGVTNSTVAFGNTTIPNTNSVTVPAIRSIGCSGSTAFGQANINMNSAGGFEPFTNLSTPGDNNGDGDALYISNFTGTGFSINGGIIENAGDDGIDIRNSRNLNLTNVTIRDCGKNPGIAATIDHNSSGVQALNLTGTNNINGSSFLRGRLRNFYVSQTSGTTALNIASACVFDDTRSSGNPATDNFELYLDGTAIAAVDIENSSFLRSRTNQISVLLLGSSQLTKLDITGITMDYQGGASAGIFIDCGGASTANFNVMNNPKLHSQDGNVFTVAATGTAQVQGRVKDNPDMKFFGSSAGGNTGSGIRAANDGMSSTITVLIENNILEIVNCDFGVNMIVAGANSPIINGTVNNNTITATGVIHLEGIIATVNNIASVGKLICLTVNNNHVSGAALARVCRLRVLGVTGVRVTNYVTDMNTTWLANGNTGSPVTEGASGGGTIAAAPVPCALPTNPLP